MEYIIVVIVLIVLIALVQPKKNKSKSTEATARPALPKGPASDISITERKDTESGRVLEMTVGLVYSLRCHFLRNGSPWVQVEDLGHGFKPSYNVKTSRWKDGCPVLPEYQWQLSNALKSEWESARETFGKPKFDPGRKTAQRQSRPTSVNFSKRGVDFVFSQTALATLPKTISVEGSEGATYTLNLNTLECSCLDFAKRRLQFPAGDIRRMCKHQARAFSGIRDVKLTEDGFAERLVKEYASEGKGAFLYDAAIEVTINEEITGPKQFYFFVPNGDSKWADVAFSTNKGVERRVYHIEDKRWGQHSNPFPEGTRQFYNLVVSNIIS
jgi:hypothetical protein